MHIGEVSDLRLVDHLKAVDQLILTDNEATIARPILKEIKDRLTFLNNVGLNYLTPVTIGWDLIRWRKPAYSVWQPRSVPTSLVSFISWMSRLSASIKGTMDRLIASLKKMRDLGNTLIVVEHDEDTMRGRLPDRRRPRCRCLWGEIVAAGTPKQVARNSKSITGQYLSGKRKIPVPTERRSEMVVH